MLGILIGAVIIVGISIYFLILTFIEFNKIIFTRHYSRGFTLYLFVVTLYLIYCIIYISYEML